MSLKKKVIHLLRQKKKPINSRVGETHPEIDINFDMRTRLMLAGSVSR